jgi:predicted RNA-binding Zn ribbon-like protein
MTANTKTANNATAKNLFQTEGFGSATPWLDLANSDLRDGFGNARDLLDDPEWVRSFLAHWNFRLAGKKAIPTAQLRRLRNLLRSVIEKSGGAADLQGADVAQLNTWLKVAVFPRLVKNQNGFALQLRAAQIGWPAILSAIAESFARTLMEGHAGRLKLCANEGCRWAFIDRTKGNIRRWCNDATCGNRDRVRRSRAAQKHRK